MTTVRTEEPGSERRRFLKSAGSAGLVLVGIAAAGAAACGRGRRDKDDDDDDEKDEKHARDAKDEKEESGDEAEVTPGEDLMQEHGVLERVLLIYDEAARRIDRAADLDPALLTAAAGIVHRFVEEYHEKQEEEFVFPRLESAGRETALVAVLRRQHARGREVTDEILRRAGAGKPDAALAGLLRAFERMYRPHAAREDTVLFPAFRSVVGGRAYLELGEKFEDNEHQKFGAHGFEDTVAEVTRIETALGILDLAQFTPSSPPRRAMAARETGSAGTIGMKSGGAPGPAEPTRLARRLGMFDAVTIGLGSMLGAGVFAAFAPAAAAAGNGLLIGLVLAAGVAYCNATSSAELAALYPESGGAYVYGRRRLGAFWGFLAGWGFVIGKLASCAAMAMTFGSYAAPSRARGLAVGAVLAMTGVNVLGVRKTALLTKLIVGAVLGALALVVAAVGFGGAADPARLWPIAGSSPFGVLQSAGFLFFAFAGYARLATLGEEVRDPKRVIPRAIPLALGAALIVYAAVGVFALAGAGAAALAASRAPLATAVEAGSWAWSAPLVRAGAAIACLGVLLSLLAGVSRTVFAMAAEGDLPPALAAVHARAHVPHRAVLAAGGVIACLCLFLDVRPAIGFSSFAVLTYYAIANASAWTLAPEDRPWPRSLALLGLLGCALLAVTLPLSSVIGGTAVLAAGAAGYAALRRTAS